MTIIGVLLAVPFCLALAPAQAPKPGGAKPQAAGPAAGGAGAADALPNADDVHQLFNEGKYKETLQKLARLLALKGDAAKAYDRHDLLVLKAESHLRQKEATAAVAAYEQAAKEAPDAKAKAVDAATPLLIKRSKNLTFTPPAKKGAGAASSEPIDITDPEKRKEAFAAMFTELKEQAAPKFKAAKDAKSLPPIADALKVAGNLRTLEVAATGDDAEVKGMVQDLAARAKKMMADAIDGMTKAVADIEASANNLQPARTITRSPLPGGGAFGESTYRKRGLMTPDVNELKRIISDMQKLAPAAKEMGMAMGDSGEEFTQIAKNAADLHDKAREVLTHDYANDYTRSNRPVRDRNVR
jgi:hypothetical protein